MVMPNLTPVKYRRLYEIYPAKACIDESADRLQPMPARTDSLARPLCGTWHRAAEERLRLSLRILPDASSRICAVASIER